MAIAAIGMLRSVILLGIEHSEKSVYARLEYAQIKPYPPSFLFCSVYLLNELELDKLSEVEMDYFLGFFAIERYQTMVNPLQKVPPQSSFAYNLTLSHNAILKELISHQFRIILNWDNIMERTMDYRDVDVHFSHSHGLCVEIKQELPLEVVYRKRDTIRFVLSFQL